MTGRRGWPATMVTIAEAIGDDAARSLVNGLGGTRIRIPRHPRPDSHLTKVLGPVAVLHLATALAGAEFDIPTAAILRCKKTAILGSIEAGGNAREIAREHGVTMRYVRRLKSISLPPKVSRVLPL